MPLCLGRIFLFKEWNFKILQKINSLNLILLGSFPVVMDTLEIPLSNIRRASSIYNAINNRLF